MKEKYVIRDFHPLVPFYLLGLSLAGAGFTLGLLEVVLRLMGNPIPVATIVLVALLVVSGLQLLLFAMWFDMESNRALTGVRTPPASSCLPASASSSCTRAARKPSRWCRLRRP